MTAEDRDGGPVLSEADQKRHALKLAAARCVAAEVPIEAALAAVRSAYATKARVRAAYQEAVVTGQVPQPADSGRLRGLSCVGVFVDEITHLRDDAPHQRCDQCGRCTWAVAAWWGRCGMRQPDDTYCGGTFQPDAEGILR